MRTKSTIIKESEIQYNIIGILLESNSITNENSLKKDNKICYNNEYYHGASFKISHSLV
jgi:hypothetical protein